MNSEKYTQIAIEALREYEKNARTHSDEQIDKICRSIEEFGFINPVLVNQENVIIAGHGRVRAAKKLGMKEVPCLRVEHLTDEQMRAYVIADNKLAEDAGWDEQMLKIELEDLDSIGFDISLTGFEIDEIEVFSEPDEEYEDEEADGVEKKLLKCPVCGHINEEKAFRNYEYTE